jgi:hypothetical protein
MRYRSSAYSRRTGLSVVLKIRVSMVDGLGPSVALALRACCACPNSLPANLSVPGHHFQLFELHAISGINRGLSGAILPRNRPTIGLSGSGSVVRRPAGWGARTPAHLTIRHSTRAYAAPRARACDSGRPRIFTLSHDQPYSFATRSSCSIDQPGALRGGACLYGHSAYTRNRAVTLPASAAPAVVLGDRHRT